MGLLHRLLGVTAYQRACLLCRLCAQRGETRGLTRFLELCIENGGFHDPLLLQEIKSVMSALVLGV